MLSAHTSIKIAQLSKEIIKKVSILLQQQLWDCVARQLNLKLLEDQAAQTRNNLELWAETTERHREHASPSLEVKLPNLARFYLAQQVQV